MPNVLGVPAAPLKLLPAAGTEPERAELHLLADTLPIEAIQDILKNAKGRA